MTITLDDRQRATILAALHLYRQLRDTTYGDRVKNCATAGGKHEPLTDSEIGELRQELFLPDVRAESAQENP